MRRGTLLALLLSALVWVACEVLGHYVRAVAGWTDYFRPTGVLGRVEVVHAPQWAPHPAIQLLQATDGMLILALLLASVGQFALAARGRRPMRFRLAGVAPLLVGAAAALMALPLVSLADAGQALISTGVSPELRTASVDLIGPGWRLVAPVFDLFGARAGLVIGPAIAWASAGLVIGVLLDLGVAAMQRSAA